METNEKNLRNYIKDECYRITNESSFTYGLLDRNETYDQLSCLLRIVRKFDLGPSLDKYITNEQSKIRWYFIHSKLDGWEKYDAIEKMMQK